MLWLWTGFLLLLAALLAVDLGVLHRRPHTLRLREALLTSAGWITAGLAFAGVIYLVYDRHWGGAGLLPDAVDLRPNAGLSATLKYLTGFLVEKSLSIDNLFLMALILASMHVPAMHQHRVLFAGVIGALLLRGPLIVAGSGILARYHWVTYLFGAMLLVAAARFAFGRDANAAPRPGRLVQLARRWFGVSADYNGGKFTTRINGRRVLTPLALALIGVEGADFVIALDSIPAIFAVTADPFLIFTSNAFALLGLRSLYFVLAGLMSAFTNLKYSLAAILALVGGKMMTGEWIHARLGPGTDAWMLLAIALILAAGVVASLATKAKRNFASFNSPGCVHPSLETRS